MKKITLFLMAVLLAMTTGLTAQQACVADPTKLYFTTNAGWSQSEWFPIINIDAERLTPEATGIIAHTGANGSATTTAWSTGVFTTPVFNVDAQMNPVETNLRWPVHFYLASLANNLFNSAYTKVVELGTNPSGGGTEAACYFNNNSVVVSPIWNKRGFIELSRQASAVANTPPSRHGFIELRGLPQVERVQWSFSSTAWRRGVKLDIRHGDGAWEPLRWIPSDQANSLGSFTEQGYAFEEIIGKQEDPSSKISLRWRIWDGDSIHDNVTRTDGSKYTLTMTPFASRQVVRIHQIKIFSGVVPTEAPSAVRNPSDFFLHIYRSGDNIAISEVAKVEVFAINGKKMYSGTTNLINAHNFERGVYLIKATGADGRVQNQKIIL